MTQLWGNQQKFSLINLLNVEYLTSKHGFYLLQVIIGLVKWYTLKLNNTTTWLSYGNL